MWMDTDSTSTPSHGFDLASKENDTHLLKQSLLFEKLLALMQLVHKPQMAKTLEGSKPSRNFLEDIFYKAGAYQNDTEGLDNLYSRYQQDSQRQLREENGLGITPQQVQRMDTGPSYGRRWY